MHKSKDKSIIENFVDCLQLDLVKDFPNGSNLNNETSAPLVNQMRKLEKKPFQKVEEEVKYPTISKESMLSDLAQKMSIATASIMYDSQKIAENFSEIMTELYIPRYTGDWWIKRRCFPRQREITIEQE